MTISLVVFSVTLSADAQQRHSSIRQMEDGSYEISTHGAEQGALAWQVALESSKRQQELTVRRLSANELPSVTTINLGFPISGVSGVEVFGPLGHEIAVISLQARRFERPADNSIDAIRCIVRLRPNLELMATLSQRNQSGVGASRNGRDYFSFCCGFPISETNLEVVSFQGQLFEVREEFRRLQNHRKMFSIGKRFNVIDPNRSVSPVPPLWLSETMSEAMLDDPVGAFPLSSVERAGRTIGVVLANPEIDFPPSTINLQISVGEKRAHGLLFRNLSAARSRDRQTKEDRIETYQSSISESPAEDHSLSKGFFYWSPEAHSEFGILTIDVLENNPDQMIGLIERPCSEDLPFEAIPPRDLWLFSIDKTKPEPLWIEADLVESCILFPQGQFRDVEAFGFRSFDNGSVEPVTTDSALEGYRIFLRPAIHLVSDGVQTSTPDVARTQIEPRETTEIRDFDPFEHDYAEVNYPLARPNKSFQADRDPRERGPRPLNSNR